MENEPSNSSAVNNNEAAIMAARRVNRSLGSLASGAFGVPRRTVSSFVERVSGGQPFGSEEKLNAELSKNDVKIGLLAVSEAAKSDDSHKAGWGAAIAARGVIRAAQSAEVTQNATEDMALRTVAAFDDLPSESFIPLSEKEIDQVRNIALNPKTDL